MFWFFCMAGWVRRPGFRTALDQLLRAAFHGPADRCNRTLEDLKAQASTELVEYWLLLVDGHHLSWAIVNIHDQPLLTCDMYQPTTNHHVHMHRSSFSHYEHVSTITKPIHFDPSKPGCWHGVPVLMLVLSQWVSHLWGRLEASEWNPDGGALQWASQRSMSVVQGGAPWW